VLLWQTIRRIRTWLVKVLWIIFSILLVAGSTVQLRDPDDHVHLFTRQREFDFTNWTLDALLVKFGQVSLGAAGYLSEFDRQELVLTYFNLIIEARQLETRLTEIYADPSLTDKESAVAQVIIERNSVWNRQSELQPIVETVLQEQISFILADLGLDLGGAPFPPVAFHFTRPPMALIVSPRDIIRQEANISMDPDLTLEEQIILERQVEGELDVSALVVPVGGVGIYPTMIQETSSVVWLTETIVHEWVHNYLTLHPLGFNYYTSPELRAMNETTASLLGKEIGREVLEHYYPDFVPPPLDDPPQLPYFPSVPIVFDFRAEMYLTRVLVDELLAQGEIEEAEAYMEARRQFLWENGYYIRRINQAYFAFYGAYADEPGGAAGDDPVGAAVRQLWDKIGSPAEFLRTMARMNDYVDLQVALEN
jgi:hypothetical protein